jgi:hypothetical protein
MSTKVIPEEVLTVWQMIAKVAEIQVARIPKSLGYSLIPQR